MTEFAGDLGLSRSTVSYILNGKWRERNIKKETVERVLAYAEEVKFVPNIIGQAMKGKISTDVALLLPSSIYDHHKQAFFDFISLFDRKKYSYMIFPLKVGAENMEAVNQLITFKARNVLIFAGPAVAVLNQYRWWHKIMKGNPDIRWFFYDYRFEFGYNSASFPRNSGGAGFDRSKAIDMVLDYVAAAGYRKLLWRAFPLTPENRNRADMLQLEIVELPGYDSTLELSETGRRYGRFLSECGKPSERTAVFISDDIMTIGAVSYLLEHGFRVPEDYAFISWDGLSISRYFLKPVTTLVVPHAEMIQATAAFLAGEEQDRFINLKPAVRPGKTL
jgi:LacI family transcriptional regulator